jgi:hypothetical protein
MQIKASLNQQLREKDGQLEERKTKYGDLVNYVVARLISLQD